MPIVVIPTMVQPIQAGAMRVNRPIEKSGSVRRNRNTGKHMKRKTMPRDPVTARARKWWPFKAHRPGEILCKYCKPIVAACHEALATLTCKVDHSFGRNGGRCCLAEHAAIAALREGRDD